MGVAQTIPSGGQTVVPAEWSTLRNTLASTIGQMIAVSANGEYYAARTNANAPTSIEIRRTSDNSVVSAILQFGTLTTTNKFIDLSADGKYLAFATTGAGNERVNIWDVESGSRVAAIAVTWSGATGASAVAFSPNLTGTQYLAVAPNVAGAPIRVYNVSPAGNWNFDVFTEFSGTPPLGLPVWLNWNNDASQLAATTNNTTLTNRLRVWNFSSPGAPLAGFVPSVTPGATGTETRAFFNNSGSRLILSGNTGFAQFDTSDGSEVSITTGLTSVFRSFLFNATDTRFIGRPSTTLVDYDPAPDLTYTSPTAAQYIGGARNSNNFIVAATGQASATPGVNEMVFRGYTFGNPNPTWETTRTGTTQFCQLTNLLLVEGGASIIVGFKDFSGNQLNKINAATGQVVARQLFAGVAQMNQLALSNDGTIVYIAMPNNPAAIGRIERVNVSDLNSAGTPFESTPAFTPMRGVAVVPMGPFAGNVYGLDDTGRITLFDSTGLQLDSSIPGAGGVPANSATLAMAPNGESFYFGQDTFVHKMGVGATVGTPLSSVDLGAANSASSIAVSPDSRRVAIARRVVGSPNLLFSLVYDNTVADSFANLITAPNGFSGGTNVIASLGITWMSNDYYALPFSTLGSAAYLQNTPLFASERPVRLDPILSLPSSVATINYSQSQQAIYFGGFWNGDIQRHRMPEAAIIINKPDAGATTATQVFAMDTVFTESWGNTSGWERTTTGDFNGDGRADIVWHNGTTNQTAVWTMVGANVVDGRTYSTGTWIPTHTGDFNGNGHDDILFRSGDDVAIWFMNGTRVEGS
ncbi:MAG: FG-GAP-like repeat-containing protein, partial [Fimbriimonadaceae bacterium]